MKDILFKTYIISSILAFPIYLSLLLIVVTNINIPSFVANIAEFWIPVILIANAVFGVPTIINRKLNDEEKIIFTRILKIASLFLIVLAMILIYQPRQTEGWEIVFAWVGNVVLLFPIIGIESARVGKRDKDKKSHNKEKSVSLIFYMGLIM